MQWIDLTSRKGSVIGGEIELLQKDMYGRIVRVLRGQIDKVRIDSDAFCIFVQRAMACRVDDDGGRSKWMGSPEKLFRLDMQVCSPEEKEARMIQLRETDEETVTVYLRGGPPLYSSTLKMASVYEEKGV